MGGHGEKLSRQEDAAIAALLNSRTIGEAATKAKIGESTLRRWLKQPGFRARFREARQAVVEHAIAGIQRATSGAVEALERNLTCGKATAEVQAARAIIEQALRATELDDIMGRIEDLEQAAGTGGGR